MQDVVTPALVHWDNFLVIVGSSGAALTGLQFVVMALISESRRQKTSGDTIKAFGTPTIVHFCAVLLAAAVLSAPWQTLSSPAILLGIAGAAGAIYVALVARRAHQQTDYQLVLEDWIWHTALPFLAYATMLIGAITLSTHPTGDLFAIAATMLLLLFIGIHNAWDTVAYIVVKDVNSEQPKERVTPTGRSRHHGRL